MKEVRKKMRKSEALEILGGGGYGSITRTAALLEYRHSAVSKWPEVLPDRVAQRVIGCALWNGRPIPEKYMKPVAA